MPERNIVKVSRSGREFQVRANSDTISIFAKARQPRFGGTINSILDTYGNVLRIVNEKHEFEVGTTFDLGMFYLDLPRPFLEAYGIREGEFVDLVLEEVIEPLGIVLNGKAVEIRSPLFPRMFRYGLIQVSPKSGLPRQPIVTETLVEKVIPEPFYDSLLREINEAYGYGHYRSTLVLLRVLFENLVIDVLRARYGEQGRHKYYNTVAERFHRFSTLIRNLRQSITDLRPYSASLDDAAIDKLDAFREKGNAPAHTIDADLSPQFFKDMKTDINYSVELLQSIKTKLASAGS